MGITILWLMLWKKTFRIFRFSWPVFCEWALEPVFNRGLIIALSAPAITLSFNRYLGETKMTDEIEALIIGGIVFVASYTIYLLIGLFCSPFISFKREKEKGNYFNNRFVYHDPLHVYTTIIKPEDHGKNITFMVNDAEPNSLVCFDFQYRGGLSYVSVFTPQDHVKNLSQSENFRSMKMSKRINKRRQATFVCSSSPNSDDTQLRVYMLSWEY